MITVLFLQTSLRMGGAEQVWIQLIERLDRTRFRPLLGCVYEPGVLGERLRARGLPVYAALAANRWDVRVFPRLLRLLRQERVEILYLINQPLIHWWGLWCGRIARVPLVISSSHTTGMSNRARRRRWVEQPLLRQMDHVIALSETHKQHLIEHASLQPDCVTVIPNGIDVERFAVGPSTAALRVQCQLPSEAPIVGIVAMLRPEKAHDVFLRAAALVVQRVPQTHFLIVGDGSERSQLEALARSLGIAACVHFLGVRTDVPDVVRLFDVAALSSTSEILSLSVLEYMAAGKPVVATRVGSLPELIQEGQTGFLVEPQDSAALADRIIRLLQNRILADQMGEAGRRMIHARYTVQQMIRQTERLFEQLLNHRQQASCVP